MQVELPNEKETTFAHSRKTRKKIFGTKTEKFTFIEFCVTQNRIEDIAFHWAMKTQSDETQTNDDDNGPRFLCEMNGQFHVKNETKTNE